MFWAKLTIVLENHKKNRFFIFCNSFYDVFFAIIFCHFKKIVYICIEINSNFYQFVNYGD